MKRCVAILLAWVLCSAAPVAALTVRTGDHEDFTRVVMPIPTGARWQVARDAQAIDIRFDELQTDFDLSDVYRRISRTRIAEISAQGSSLRLTLACPCDYQSFETASGLLVVDIQDPQSAQPLLGQDITGLATALLPNASTRVQSVFEVSAGQAEPDLRGDPFIQGGDAPDPAPPMEARAVSPVFSGQTLLSELETATRRQQSENSELAESLSQALSQSVAAARDVGLLQGTEREAVIPGSPDDTAPTGLQNIRILGNTTPFSDGVASEISNCIDDRMLDLSLWAPDSDFQTALSAVRSATVDETGQVTPEGALDLARLYLRFGLAIEAQAALNQAETGTDKYKIARSVASQLAGETTQSENLFSDQIECASDAAFWALLSEDNKDRASEVDVVSVMQAFARLPKEVQTILQPDFKQQLLWAGFSEQAQDLEYSNPLQTGPVPTGVQQVAEPPILDQNVFAEADLSEMSPPHDPMPHIVAQVNDAWRANEVLQPNIIALMDSFVVEHRSTDAAPVLNHTLIRALLLTGDFDRAFEVLHSSDLGPMKPQARAEFVTRIEADLTGFERAKFRYLVPDQPDSRFVDAQTEPMVADVSPGTASGQLTAELPANIAASSASEQRALGLEVSRALLGNSARLRQQLTAQIFEE